VARRSVGFGRPSPSLARGTLGFGLKSHIGRVMLLGNYRLDQWILGAIAGATQLGLYSVAVAFAEALFLLPTALSAVQRPELVRASEAEASAPHSVIFRASLS
jgi:O-antigen/teichoic acid export membrane protein